MIGLIHRISQVGGALSAAAIALGMTLVLGEIAARGLFSSTLYVTEEYSGYLMAASVYLGLAYTLREGAHIRMGFIFHALPEGMSELVERLCSLLGLIFSLVLLHATFALFWDSYRSGTVSMQISSTPLAIPQFFLPAGILMMSLQHLADLLSGSRRR